MTIEANTFKKVINLSPEHMLDLVQTVGKAALSSTLLMDSREDKIAIAFAMLNYANSILEECNCEVKMMVTNPEWDDTMIYGSASKIDKRKTGEKEEHNGQD